MTKPELKVENGMVEVKLAGQLDKDSDGKPSVKGSLLVEIDAYELVTEIAKKDIALLETILKQFKVNA